MSKRKSPEILIGLDRLVTERVIEAREAARLNKREFSERLGLADSSYSPYEAYKIPFTIDMIQRISRILGRPVEYFLGLDTGLTEDEDQLLASYRAIDNEDIKRLALTVVQDSAAIYIVQPPASRSS
jgi:transcriptional regulator with XRE-family HTH domain